MPASSLLRPLDPQSWTLAFLLLSSQPAARCQAAGCDVKDDEIFAAEICSVERLSMGVSGPGYYITLYNPGKQTQLLQSRQEPQKGHVLCLCLRPQAHNLGQCILTPAHQNLLESFHEFRIRVFCIRENRSLWVFQGNSATGRHLQNVCKKALKRRCSRLGAASTK